VTEAEAGDVDVPALLAAAAAARPDPVGAKEHAGGLGSATRPQKFFCSEPRRLYAVKFAQNNHGDGRGIFNEQVVGLLGALLQAPVPRVELVLVPHLLVDDLLRDKSLHNLDFDPQAGVHHGSLWAERYSDRMTIEHVDANRQRFGSLDILHQWTMCSGDQQWIYSNAEPHHVLSVDHTTFFPNGSAWTKEQLEAQRSNVAPDPALAPVNLKAEDRAPALTRLRAASDGDIVAAVGRPPDEWGVSQEERAALVEYLLERRDAVLNYHAANN